MAIGKIFKADFPNNSSISNNNNIIIIISVAENDLSYTSIFANNNIID